MTEPPERIPRRWYDVVLDVLAVAGVLAMVAFPVAALTSVSPEPKVVDAAAALPPAADHPRAGGPLRDLPVFSVGGAADAAAAGGRLTTRAAIDVEIARQSQAVFGRNGDRGLLTIAGGCVVPACVPTDVAATAVGGRTVAPFRFASIDRILDATLGPGPLPPERIDAVGDLAGLLVLARQAFPETYRNATAVAYALYDRARGTGTCAPQLNLALLTADARFDQQQYDDTVAEYRKAVTACGVDDPTPLWLLGQFQSVQQRAAAARATFEQLETRLPGSVLGWSGEADALVRDAYRVNVAAPFTARADFRRATALYQRARAIDDRDPGLAAGVARARSGLGDYVGAASLERDVVDRVGVAASGPFQARLVGDLERAGRFASDAAERARHFAEAAGSARVDAAQIDARVRMAPATPPVRPGIFVFGSDAADSNHARGAVVLEQALGPISIGASRLRPLRDFGNTLAFTDGVADISFIPQFRESPLTTRSGTAGFSEAPGCRASRDLLLAGRVPEAQRGFLDRPVTAGGPNAGGSNAGGSDPRPDRCGDESLRAVVDYEAGTTATPSADLLDADQNLWRFAGDLERAAAAAKTWTSHSPRDARAQDRAGEIAFLQKRYRAAAGHFHHAAALVHDEAVAHEEIKEGTALEQIGELTRAAKVLEDADRVASAAIPPGGYDFQHLGDPQAITQATLDSYNARLQQGDTALRSHTKEMSTTESAHTFREAEDHYVEAREREAELGRRVPLAQRTTERYEPLFRPEVLENNEALVLLQLGEHAAASKAIGAAVAIDRRSPVFLANRGYIEEQLGDRAAAAATYREALTADPSAYQAANNLGVILADDGHLSEAAAAFRHALAAKRQYATPDFEPADDGHSSPAEVALVRPRAADRDYPIAAFNLGLVLNRMGPTHLLESQGELAAATRSDPELREHDHELISDDDTVFTTLDLSKPLPADWHLASAEQHAPVTAAGVVLALLLFLALKTVVEEKLKEKATEELLEAEDRHLTRTRRISERIPAAVALVAVVGVFAIPIARSSGATRNDYLLIGIGVAITTLAFMRLRSAMARRAGVATRHYAHLPAVLIGGATALLSLGYAPMPASKDHESLPDTRAGRRPASSAS